MEGMAKRIIEWMDWLNKDSNHVSALLVLNPSNGVKLPRRVIRDINASVRLENAAQANVEANRR